MDAWTEVAYISIAEQGEANYEFASPTSSIDIDEGDKEFDSVPNMKGGRLIVDKAQEDTMVTLELYPIELSPDDNLGGLSQYLNGVGTMDVAGAMESTTSRNRLLMRISILWTDDSDAATGITAVASGSTGIRWVGAEGRLVSLKKSFTDGVLKHTAKFRFPPFDKDGSANIHEESCDATAELAAIDAYTSSNKFR